MLQEYLFSLIKNLLPLLIIKYNRVQLLFPSIGDAASFQKYIRKIGVDIGENVILSGLLYLLYMLL